MTATWDQVLGQTAAVGLLRASIRRDEVAHAWLLVGPQRVGQAEAAAALTAALNCERSVDGQGCGTCSICERVARGTYSGLHTFEPTGAQHRVADVRELWIPTALRTLVEGRRKTIRVVAADRMNETTQNAFLKILEEPPPSVVWILEVEDDSRLLDTVVSRCRRVDFVPWGPDALTTFGERLGLRGDELEVSVRAALGSPQRLEDLARRACKSCDAVVAAGVSECPSCGAATEPDDARIRHTSVVSRLAGEGPGAVIPIAEELMAWARSRQKILEETLKAERAQIEEEYGGSGRRGGMPAGMGKQLEQRAKRLVREEQRLAVRRFLDDVSSWMKDLIALHADAHAAIVNVDRLEELRHDAARLTMRDAFAVLDEIVEIETVLDENNAQPQLQVERLLMQIAVPVYRNAA